MENYFVMVRTNTKGTPGMAGGIFICTCKALLPAAPYQAGMDLTLACPVPTACKWAPLKEQTQLVHQRVLNYPRIYS